MSNYVRKIIYPFFTKSSKDYMWINICKTLAIIGVLIDHLQIQNDTIKYLSYFSVELFVFISGYNTYLSLNKTDKIITKTIYKILILLFHYILACLMCWIILYHTINCQDIFNNIICFSTFSSHYYVALYLQLILISPALFYLLKKYRNKKYFMVFLSTLIIIIAFMTSQKRLLPIHGSGGCLFGGSEIIPFYFGLLFSLKTEENKSIANIKIKLVLSLLLLISVSVFLCVDKLNIEKYINLGNGYNPPGLTLIIYSISIAIFFFYLDKANILKCSCVSSFLSKHTLYIFLYHQLLSCFISNKVFLFLCQIIIPIIIEFIIKNLVYFIKTFSSNCYNKIKKNYC